MIANSQIPEMKSYEEIAEFWDTHSLADFWDQTEVVTVEISPQARRRYLVAIEPNLLLRVQEMAQRRGVATESFINLLLAQRLHELEMQPA